MSNETSNIEQLVHSYASKIATEMSEIARWAKSEEDIRYECNKLLDSFLQEAGIQVKGRHEYGLAGGRIDSKYGGVIIEYKAPKGAGKITEDRKSPGAKAIIKQIQKRFTDFQNAEHIESERLFAVGCDGEHLIFVRFRGGKFEIDGPQPVNPYVIERLLRALISLGAQGYSFTPDHLVDHFGAASGLTQNGVRGIYKVISTTDNPKARRFFKQWKILFSEVCGYDVEDRSEKIKELGKNYQIPNAQPAELLFSVHTYYAIFMKFLAAEIASSFSPIGISVIKRCVDTSTSTRLHREMENLEQGGIWSQLNIRNFLEGDLFSWYLSAWNDHIADIVWEIVRMLDQYDPTTLSVEPSESRDLLKKLYQHLFPKSVRHDLGEYYTPDWLAEFVLNEVMYDGNPDKRLLDPSCGSGTFLVMAINRIKIWFDLNRDKCGFGEKDLIQKILRNIVGFDLNPLAVLAARTNYLLAIRDLIKYTSSVELPVYLCDSILTPATGSHEAQVSFLSHTSIQYDPVNPPMAVNTAAGIFFVPHEIATSREKIGKYADTLESCIHEKYETDDFLALCREQGLPVDEEDLHRQLYLQLRKLDEHKEDGIWARIIKNSFAPLFTEQVDYVVGNPPWVTWINLPKEYRENTKVFWIDKYKLMASKVSRMSNLGQVCKDLSMLFTVASLDVFMKPDGILGFVITQSVFQSPAGYEFRRFNIPHRGDVKINSVEDFVAVNPFDSATNRTATFTARLGKKTLYPMNYTVWIPRNKQSISSDDSLETVLEYTKQNKRFAFPSTTDKQSVWIIRDEREYVPRPDQSYLTAERYRARLGVKTGLEGVYRVQAAKSLSPKEVLVSNVTKGAKRKVEEVKGKAVESALIYPYLRGRDCGLYGANSSGHLIVPHTKSTGMQPIDEQTMKTTYSKTYRYLKHFREALESRAIHQQWGANNPFYSIYDIGPYTFAPWKVVWGRVNNYFAASVIGHYEDNIWEPKLLIPTETVLAIAFEDENEAHFLCGYVNAPQNRDLINRSITIHPDSQILEIIQLPLYDPKDEVHQLLSLASKTAHHLSNLGQPLDVIEEITDLLVSNIWGTGGDNTARIKGLFKKIENP